MKSTNNYSSKEELQTKPLTWSDSSPCILEYNSNTGVGFILTGTNLGEERFIQLSVFGSKPTNETKCGTIMVVQLGKGQEQPICSADIVIPANAGVGNFEIKSIYQSYQVR